jgi:hypothetical protein
LFGTINILFVFGDRSNRYSIIVMLVTTSILWVTRSIFQLIYPQGSLFPGLQYGMLIAFTVISLCFIIPMIMMLSQKIVI